MQQNPTRLCQNAGGSKSKYHTTKEIKHMKSNFFGEIEQRGNPGVMSSVRREVRRLAERRRVKVKGSEICRCEDSSRKSKKKIIKKASTLGESETDAKRILKRV